MEFIFNTLKHEKEHFHPIIGSFGRYYRLYQTKKSNCCTRLQRSLSKYERERLPGL